MKVSWVQLFIFGIVCVFFGYSLYLLGDGQISGYSVNDWLLQSDDRSFINICNDKFGEPQWYTVSWVILPVDEYTSYSHEFFEEQPMIHIGGFGQKGKLYYCDDVKNWPKINTSRSTSEVNKTW